MSHALISNSWTPARSAKSGPRSSALVGAAAGVFGVRRASGRRSRTFHVDVMHHTVSDVIHNHCGHAAML